MEDDKIQVANVESILMEEFFDNNGGDARNYEQWRQDNKKIIKLFCKAIEEGDKKKLNICSNETDKKLLEIFLLVSIRIRYSYGTERLFDNEKIRKQVKSKGLQYIIEDRWIEGIRVFPWLYVGENDWIIHGVLKKIIKEKWLEAFQIIWKWREKSKNLIRLVLRERWVDALKFIIIGYKECYKRKEFVKILLEDHRINDLEFLLDNNLCELEYIVEGVVWFKWKKGIVFLIKHGVDSQYLFKYIVSYSWLDVIEMFLDKIDSCDHATCNKIYNAVIKKERYDLLEKCLDMWGNLSSIDLSECSGLIDILEVVEIAEKYNYNRENWIAQTNALFEWCKENVSYCYPSKNRLEKWKCLTSIDLSWYSDVEIIDVIKQKAEKINLDEAKFIEEMEDDEKWKRDEEWRCDAEKKMIIEFLLKHGADVNRYGDRHKYSLFPLKGQYYVTPLHIAVEQKEYDTIKLLLEYGADVNAGIRTDTPHSPEAPYEGLTPLGALFWPEHASENQKKYMEIVELLVKNGAKTMCLSEKQPTFFLNLVQIYNRRCYSCQNIIHEKVLSLIEFVCQNGEDIYKSFARWDDKDRYETRFGCDKEGNTYEWTEYNHKQLIAEYSSKDIVEILIKHGLDINSNFGLGRTLLHYCALKGEEMIEFLVNKGADVNAKDFYGQTPLLYVLCKCGRGDNLDSIDDYDYLSKDIIKAYYSLVKYGADEMVVDSNGRTAKELLEFWKECYERYEEEWDIREDMEMKQYEERGKNKKYGVLESLLEQYGGDEDAMQSDPDYWDYMYSLSDD